MILISFVLTLIFIIWFWYINLNHPKLPTADINDIPFKTGDLIIFHAYDNIYPTIFGSYWTHVGIVYKPDDKAPLLFEAVNLTCYKKKTSIDKGIKLVDLKTRLARYPGYIAYKRLDIPVDAHATTQFTEFIKYALENYSYNNKVILNWYNKVLGEPYNFKTNCGELAILSIIHMGLLNDTKSNKNICHPLLYLANLKKLNKNFYHDPVKIFIDSFYE